MTQAYIASSQRDNWRTPVKIYEALNQHFSFNFDPCPPDPQFDGLTVDWGTRSFVNPPYGRELPKWIKKGYEESQRGKLVVFLIPSRTDTIWWHQYVMQASEIWFVKGRLHFDDCKDAAPFPSCLVVFDPNDDALFPKIYAYKQGDQYATSTVRIRKKYQGNLHD